jgi:hypothetical protein
LVGIFTEAKKVMDENKPVANQARHRKNECLYEGIRAFRGLHNAEFELWSSGTIPLPQTVASSFPFAEIGYTEPFPEWFPVVTAKRNELLDMRIHELTEVENHEKTNLLHH